MKYKKQTWGIIFMSLLVSSASFAKVTYEDAIADNASATAKHKQWFTEYSKPENNRPLETSVANESPDEWHTIYSGSTTGRVNIFPHGAKEAYVVTNTGSFLILKDSPNFSLGVATSYSRSCKGSQAVSTATGNYESDSVIGSVGPRRSISCSNSSGNNNRTYTTQASFLIKKVMVK